MNVVFCVRQGNSKRVFKWCLFFSPVTPSDVLRVQQKAQKGSVEPAEQDNVRASVTDQGSATAMGAAERSVLAPGAWPIDEMGCRNTRNRYKIVKIFLWGH